ncbi:6-phosphogluconolactonase [Cerasicoccus frondis]|uniref:6-phosphogluconolactonase n=1 Tax=Cerasicoccus frondis TaxID=490090 RepID=UPI0028527372|nr:6-phosphogluconolactonase [Cerasicoccus frondis]
MKTFETNLGQVHVLPKEAIYIETMRLIKNTLKNASGEVVIGLTGGSTPKAFYEWAANHQALASDLKDRVVWSTSDERCVPLNHDESNFGHADRGMLTPLSVATEYKMPWAVDLNPHECADEFNHRWNDRFGAHRGFDICFLGMGGDNHTASLYPHCPLIGSNHHENFAAIEWPGKGWRLTITPEGFSRCKQIVVTVRGEVKEHAIFQAFHGDFNPREKPVHLLRAHAHKVLWLLDPPAAEGLDLDLG